MEHATDPKDDGRRVPAATYAWMIPVVTRIARRHGYAIGVHGSMGRDLDLIAVPWVADANEPEEMLAEICSMLDGSLVPERDGVFHWDKPNGRKTYNIVFHGAWHFIDISVMPKIAVAKSGDLNESAA